MVFVFFLLGKATTQVLGVALKARSYPLGPLHPTLNFTKFLEDLIDDFLPFNAHKIASGRLYISMTRVHIFYPSLKNVVVHEYPSRKDLIQVN